MNPHHNTDPADSQAINTRAAWRPILRPIGKLLIAAHLALVLQPLSALAQDKGQVPFNPAAQAQVQRYAQLNQTLQQAKAISAANNKSAADQASDKLKQAQELVARLKRGGTPNKAQKQSDLKALLANIRAAQADVRAEFAATKADLQKKNLPAEILQRHDEAVAQFEQRVAQFNDIAGKSDADQIVQGLDGFFKQYPSQRKPRPFDKKLPWSTPQPNTRQPAETKTAWHQNLYADQKIRLAQAGANIGPLQFNIPPEPGQAPTVADLAETDEIQLTAAIQAKAAELGNNPVNIYNWVRNNIEFAPTAGAIQSAQDTLDKKRGNATDTAGLLIALLRAANIPARYQYGTIDVPAEQAMNWVGGATKAEAALTILNQGGIAARGIGSGGRIATIRLEHVWVYAYVNWTPSRGNRNATGSQHPNPNAQLNAWVPLDAAFKQYTYTAGLDLKAQVPLDANALLSAAQQGATVNEAEGWVQNLNQAAIQSQLADYQNRLQTFINSTPTGANSTVGDVIGKKIIPQKLPSLLAGTLANPIVTQGSQVSAVPSAQQHQFTYRLYASETDQANDNRLVTFTEKTSKLVGKRLTLSYVPATQADADTIASFLPKPHTDGTPIQPSELPTSLPGYLIHLKATINLDGQVVAQATQALQMGTDLLSTGGFTQLYDTNQFDLTSEESNVAGQATAIGISAGGISGVQLSRLEGRVRIIRSQLQNANSTVSLAGLNGEQISGDLLTATIWSWFVAADSHRLLSENQAGVIENAGLSYGLFHAIVSPIYSWGVIRKVTFPGINIDVGHVRNLTWAKDNDQARWIAYNRLRGQNMSALEHAVPERFFNNPSQCNPEEMSVPNPNLPACPRGISAIKAMATGAQAGQKVFTITQDVYQNNPNIVRTNLSAHSQSTSDRIQQALDAGYEVSIHEAPITQDGWTGAGFSVLDPITGAGGYLIEGGANGGVLPSKVIAEALDFVGLGHVTENVSVLIPAVVTAMNAVTFAQTWLEGIFDCYQTEIINSISIIAVGIAVAFLVGSLTGGTGAAPAFLTVLAAIAPQTASAAQNKVCKLQCSKASNSQLASAIPEPILDAEQFKIDEGFGPPTSPFDICACKDGSLIIYGVGACGQIKPDIDFHITDHRWKL